MQIPTITLRDGLSLPAVGFGTSGLKGPAGIETIDTAIANGYRLIDTAYNYENEGTVGQAVKRSGIARSQLFLSSKLPGRHHKYKQAITAIQESLYRAGLDYYDLYLIHWPNPKRGEYVEAWQALLDAKRFGLVRAVGVSNFLPEHLEKLQQQTGELPEINQIELHPLFSQPELQKYDQDHEIVTEAWSPLGGVGMGLSQPIRELPLVKRLGEKYGKNGGQIILRWEHQFGVLPLPLSHDPRRQAQNLDIFDFSLTDDEMQEIINLDQDNARVSQQDPQTHEEL